MSVQENMSNSNTSEMYVWHTYGNTTTIQPYKYAKLNYTYTDLITNESIKDMLQELEMDTNFKTVDVNTVVEFLVKKVYEMQKERTSLFIKREDL